MREAEVVLFSLKERHSGWHRTVLPIAPRYPRRPDAITTPWWSILHRRTELCGWWRPEPKPGPAGWITCWEAVARRVIDLVVDCFGAKLDSYCFIQGAHSRPPALTSWCDAPGVPKSATCGGAGLWRKDHTQIGAKDVVASDPTKTTL